MAELPTEITINIDRNTACIFAPSPDPIPHYNRGRTHVPRADEIAGET